MYKKFIIPCITLVVIFSASAIVWQTYSDTVKNFSNEDQGQVSKVDTNWQLGSKTVDLDTYIENNQVSKNIEDKKQRVMLEPELINFYATLQSAVQPTKAELVTDALSVWGVSPLPQVGFSAYVRSLSGEIIAVYVENEIAKHLSNSFTAGTPVHLLAYRLYNYAKGPRLLLVGVKKADKALAEKLNQVESHENVNTQMSTQIDQGIITTNPAAK